MTIRGRVSRYVTAGVRIKSRFGALWQNWWENGDTRWDYPNDDPFHERDDRQLIENDTWAQSPRQNSSLVQHGVLNVDSLLPDLLQVDHSSHRHQVQE